jgi:hypothetical protein
VKTFVRRLLPNIVLFLVTSFICLLILEIGMRVVWGNPSPFLYPQVKHQAVRPYGYKLVANQSGTYTLDKPVRSNAQGFRGGPWVTPRDTTVPRVMIIGDSFTFGNNAAEEDTYAAVLGQLLEKKIGRVEVLNAGVGGWNIDNEAEFFVSEGVGYRADVVVLGFFHNDFQPPQDSVYIPTFSADARLDSRPWWLRWVPYRVLFWLKRSALVVYLRDRMALFDQPSDNFAERLFTNNIDYRTDRFVKYTHEQLLRIRDSAEAHGTPVIIAAIPAVNTFWLPRDSVHWVDSLAAFATRERMSLVDLSESLWKADGNRNRFFGYPWDNHFVASGHRLAAEQLVEPVAAALARPGRR